MMIHKLIVFLFLTASTTHAFAQHAVKEICADNMGNVYIINADKLSRHDIDGKTIHTFSRKKSGLITSVDVSDPMRIVVFYEQTAQVFILDNTLSINLGPVDLISKGLSSPTLVCAAPDKGLWVYDRQGFSLYYLNAAFQPSLLTANIPILAGTAFEPHFMTQDNKLLYVTDPKTGIIVFDTYGNIIKTLHFRDVNYFDVYNGHIYYCLNNTALKIELSCYATSIFNLAHFNFKSVTFRNNAVYMLNKDNDTFIKEKENFAKKIE